MVSTGFLVFVSAVDKRLGVGSVWGLLFVHAISSCFVASCKCFDCTDGVQLPCKMVALIVLHIHIDWLDWGLTWTGKMGLQNGVI